MFASFTFLGPAPYLKTVLDPSLLSVSLALVLQGFGTSALLVASFATAQQAAPGRNLTESLEVQSLVSGLFTSAFALGNFTGPTLSGILYDSIGFGYNCLVVQGIVLVVAIANVVAYLTVSQATPLDAGNLD